MISDQIMDAFMWQFVLRTRDFLDCKIFCKSGTVMTNICFLAISEFFRNIVQNVGSPTCEIIMPEHSEEEIRKSLNGFIISLTDLDYSEKPSFEYEELPSGCTTENVCGFNEGKVRDLRGKKKKELPSSDQYYHCAKKQCEICGKSFNKSQQLKMHKYQVHVEKDNYLTCLKCMGQFKTKSILLNHLKIHEPPLYSCCKCSRTFTKKGNLERHNRICIEKCR